VNALYQLKIQSIIVEGGARLLQSFIDEEIWDEARIIKNTTLVIRSGLPGPRIKDGNEIAMSSIFTDNVIICRKYM